MQKIRSGNLKEILIALIILLCVITAIGAIRINAAENSTTEDGMFEYKIALNGGFEITKYNGTDTVVEIPIEINGKYASSIGDSAFQGCSNLEEIIIPEGVTNIGDMAFADCSSLETITIPNSVTSIGVGAFSRCSKLETITIPEGVTYIDLWTFKNCSNLQTITIPNSITSIGDMAFENCANLKTITIPNSVTRIYSSAFGYCSSLTEITIPEGVTTIYKNTFMGCSSLETITIPNSVTSIGGSAFYYCSSLETITIPNSVTSIGDWAFENCSSLTEITIPEKVTNIGENAFRYCNSLVKISVDSNNKSYCDIDGVLYTKDMKEIIKYPAAKKEMEYNIAKGVTSIGTFAFERCSNLETITIPNSVTSIGDSAFSYCRSLKRVMIPNSITSIGTSAFSGCFNLTIYCKSGTTAEKYANDNNISCEIDDTKPTVTIEPTGTTYTKEPTITVYATASDSLGIGKVDILGWYKGNNEPNGDSKWKTVTATYDSATGKYKAELAFSELPDMVSGNTNNGDGEYRIKVYAYDKVGNEEFAGSEVVMYDTTPPTVSSIEVLNKTNQGYTIRISSIEDIVSGIKQLKISTWTAKDGQDDIKTDTISNDQIVNGVYEYRVKTSEHNEEDGRYCVSINIYDNVGNKLTRAGADAVIDKTPPTAGTMTMKLGSSTGKDYTNDTWTNQNVYILVNNGTDGQSGHKSTTYTINGGQEKTEPQILTETGIYEIIVKTIDNSGNIATNSYTVKIKKVDSILVTTKPSKLTYKAYDNFDTSGMKISIKYDNGDIEETTKYTILNGERLTCKVKKIEIQFNEKSEIKTEVAIQVGHIEVVDQAVKATCTEAGKTEGKHCSVCNEVLVAQQTIQAKGHTEVIDQAVKATCTEAGKTEGKHCSVCSEVLVAQQTVAAKGHTEVIDKAVEATCWQDGKTQGKHCSVCNKILVVQETIKKLGHNYTNGTCTRCGEKEPKVKVTSEKYEIGEEYITKISPKTKVEGLIKNLETNASDIKIYTKDKKEVKANELLGTGMQVELKLGKETRTLILVVTGDVNGDREVKISDMTIINRYRLHRRTLEEAELLAGDVTGDGKVDIKDIVKINRYRLNKITSL